MKGKSLFIYLFLLFTVFPVTELALLIQLGQRIGTLYVILLILVTGLLGAYLAKTQGLSVLRQLKARVGAGQIPTSELIDGVLVLFGAAFLITPGLITDAIGLTAVVPPTRTFYRELIKRRVMHLLSAGVVYVHRS